jgi:hypothetical protein
MPQKEMSPGGDPQQAAGPEGEAPAYLNISATPLMTTWDEVPLWVFKTRKDELDAMTVGADCTDYLTLYYPTSIFLEGSNEAYHVGVKPSQLPCLWVEDPEYHFLIPIPHTGKAREVEEQIKKLMRNLATAARLARSARDLEMIFNQMTAAPLAPPSNRPLWENLIMKNSKLVLILAAVLSLAVLGLVGGLVLAFVGLFGLPVAEAMKRIDPSYLLGFGFLLLLYLLLIFFGKRVRDTLQGPVTYVIYALTAGGSSFLLYKILVSSGVFKGSLSGAQFEFGGAAAFFAFMMLLGYAFDKARNVVEFGVTFYVHSDSEEGPLVLQNGTLVLQLNEPKVAALQNGSAQVARIPVGLKNQQAGVSVVVDGFVLQGNASVKLKPNAIYKLVLKKTT